VSCPRCFADPCECEALLGLEAGDMVTVEIKVPVIGMHRTRVRREDAAGVVRAWARVPGVTARILEES
jgi:hypothetical protein